MKQKYPILEFDKSKQAVINPSDILPKIDISEYCVICYFKEVVQKVASLPETKVIYTTEWESGNYPLFETEYNGKKIAFIQGQVGAPAAAGVLEESIALGCRKFIVCGGAGVLDKEIATGHIVIPESAVRDEGTSYHYIEPAREIEQNRQAMDAIIKTLKEKNVPYLTGKTWTTDGFFRETPDKVQLRKSEHCLTVEMEASAFFAVAQYREVILGQLLYGGDDVSGELWDKRNWVGKKTIRENVFWLAVEACLKL